MTLDASAAPRTSFPLRVWRAACLHADTYEEVEADPSSMGQALVLVIAACLSAALGGWLRANSGHPLPGEALPLPLHLFVVAIEPLVNWIVSGAFAYMVGATFLRGPETETDYAEVLRTTGFASGPALLFLLAWVPPEPLGLVFMGVAQVWVMLASVVAVRQALDFGTGRAIATYGVARFLMWLALWGLTVVPLPIG